MRRHSVFVLLAGLPACAAWASGTVVVPHVRPVAITNAVLELALDAAGGVSVADRRTGRVWRALKGPAVATGSQTLPDGFVGEFVEPSTTNRFRAVWRLDVDRPEFTVEVVGDGKLETPLAYPAPFATRKGDRLFYPQNEGISFPVEEKHPVAERLATYHGSGLCMAFFGVMEDATGAGWMTIVETVDDAGMRTVRDAGGCVSAGPEWCGQLGKFAYPRRARYVFYPHGGHVAACKRYRAYVRQTGLFRPFTEKLKTRPQLDRLFGAVNVWCTKGSRFRWVRWLQEAGIRRILWSGDGTPEEVKALVANPDVLIGRYDVYTDVFRPEQIAKLGLKNGWNKTAWPNDVIWSGPTSNDWLRAWSVQAPDGTWTHCATLCDRIAYEHCRRNVANDLREKPFNARFLDVTTSSSWKECLNPRHPMVRSDSREGRRRLLSVVSEEFKLVTGGETGHDFSVPVCDYYEGMLSLCPYRVPNAGRDIDRIWTNAPVHVATYQVGEKYRLPLWELVFHDCTCAHWYWGDYNNKLPQLWPKRDLFNVLYGTMGMFVINEAQWAEHKDDFVKSYAMTSPVARSTALHEMTDHAILTADRAVQRTTFANGVVVTVNFASWPWTDPSDGTFIGPRSYSVRGL